MAHYDQAVLREDPANLYRLFSTGAALKMEMIDG
jgi:hypothetical protein